MEKIIEVKNLKKSYGSVQAVNGLEFYVEKGKLFAFLGPNGAGKSTTIDIICTLLKPDDGQAIIDGHKLGTDDDKIRQSIGVVFQYGVLDNLLTVKENMQTRGALYGKKELDKRVNEAAKAAAVTDILDRRYGKLSGGQKRRADIARALVQSPKILFLDEPTTGLDPQTRKNVWQTIERLKETGMTVFLTTHYLEEADSADYVIIIDNGEIAAKGTPVELKEKYSKDSLKLYCGKNIAEIKEFLKDKNIAFKESGNIVTVPLEKTKQAIPIIQELDEKAESFEVLHGTLLDAFIEITGKELREE